MAIPSINDLTLYRTIKLMGSNLNANFTRIVNWFSDGTADISVKTITTSGSATIGGSVSIAGSLTIAGASTLIPLGTVLPYAGAAAPTGYLLCNGQAVSRTTYINLYNLVGTTFGIGDGSTTFNMPDMRESYPVGVGTYSAVTGTTHAAITAHDAFTLGEFKDDRAQGHDHNVFAHTSGSGGGGFSAGCNAAQADMSTAGNGAWQAKTLVNDGTNGTPRAGTTTRGKGLGLNFIIKY